MNPRAVSIDIYFLVPMSVGDEVLIYMRYAVSRAAWEIGSRVTEKAVRPEYETYNRR